MRTYYEDEWVTLYHGDAADVLPTIDTESVAVLLTDPPYFQVKDEEWDRQWKQAADFLAWLGSLLDLAQPALLPSGSVWVFASPQMASSVEREVASRFHVLNSVRWVKESGWHKKAEVEAQRRFLTPWEGIVFAEQADHIGRYIQRERERAGKTRRDLARLFPSKTGGETGCIWNWENGLYTPSREAYELIREALGGGYLERPYEQVARPFRLSAAAPVSDVWDFPPVMPYPGKHPCEKPVSMLTHMLRTSCPASGVVLDPFAGSASTLVAARSLGRRAIGIERDRHWCEHAARRLSQGVLDFGATA